MAYLQAELIFLCTGLLLLATMLYLRYFKRQNLPPGPVGLPIFGYYLHLRKNPVETVTNLGKRYGNVIGFYIGPQYLVVLQDWDALIDAYAQNAALHRPKEHFSEMPYHFGISGVNGPEWAQTRRQTVKVMKDIGLNENYWEEFMQEEVSDIIKRIVQHGKDPLDIKSFLSETFASNVVAMVLGERLPVGHPSISLVSKSVDTILESMETLDMINYSPRLRRILEFLGLVKEIKLRETIRNFSEYVSNCVEEKIRSPDKQTDRSFIDRYHQEVQIQKKNEAVSYITEDSLKGNVAALLSGGSETSRTTFIWLLIAMADHPEAQRKVQEELDDVIGKDGIIRWAERSKIPYTFAALMESMRWNTVAPFPTVRLAADDMQVQGYHIPKGTFLAFNMRAIHNDLKYWTEPDKFIPERLLLEDGQKVNTAPKSYCPFSYGKRDCPGKIIAMMENLIYFCRFMQEFTVVPSDGVKVNYEVNIGLTYQAVNFHLCFIPRK